MLPTKPVGEKPPYPNGGGGKTGAQDAPPAPNQDERGHEGPPGDDGAPAANTKYNVVPGARGRTSNSLTSFKFSTIFPANFDRHILQNHIIHIIFSPLNNHFLEI